MASRYVYNEVMNRWLNGHTYGDTDTDGLYKKSAVFEEGYDDPTYMTFKIEFGDWGASILDRSVVNSGVTNFVAQRNDYDALPIGLLNCPYDGSPDSHSYFQTNTSMDSSLFNNTDSYSAFRYLRSRNEDTRAEYLYYFVNGLFELQKDTPFIFQKISGIDLLERFDPKAGLRLKDAKITLQCYEGLNLKIRTLMELYRKAAWDDVYQRWILPENMREFKMIIYIFERRTFQDVLPWQVTGEDNITRQEYEMQYGSLNANIPVKAFECCPCEFDIQGSQSWIGDYSNAYENPAETSKIVINVKNVKTYFKNGLLSPTLLNSYLNDGHSVSDISYKIDSLMIYDLVETVERLKDTYDARMSNDIPNDMNSTITNSTLNGVRSLFLNKNILLENEDANYNIRSYVWGHSYSGPTSQTNGISKNQYNELSDEDKSQYTLSTNGTYVKNSAEAILDAVYSSVFDLIYSGAMYDLNTFRTYRMQMVSLYEPIILRALSDYINGILYGVGGQLMLGLFNDAPTVSQATMGMLPLMNSLNFMDQYHTLRKIDNFQMEQPREEVSLQYAELQEPRVLDNMQYAEMEDPRQVPTQQYAELEEPRELQDPQYAEIEDPRFIPEQQYAELLDPRPYPQLQYAELEDPRFIPELQYALMNDPRFAPKLSYAELQEPRNIPNQQYATMEDPRKLPDLNYAELEDPRNIPDLQYAEMEDPRKLPELQYQNMEKPRVIPELNYSLLEKERDLPNQLLIELADGRRIPKQEYAKLLEARSLPGMQDVKLEDIRDIPVENLVSLKDAAYRAMPQFKIDRMELIDTISKATTANDLKLLEIDASNKDKENTAIAALKDNKALMSLSDKLTNDETKEIKIAKLAKMLALNTDDIKSRYVDDIMEKKKQLIALTNDAVRALPDMDMYELKQDDTDKPDIAMISLTDLEYIHKNIHLISMADSEYRELSFGALISLEETLSKQVDETKKLIGLTQAASTVTASAPSNSKHRVLGNRNMKMVSMQEENDKAGKKKSVIVY